MKQKSGITLIALVITIVLLLILVAVTTSLISENGVINKAGIASNEYQKQEATETLNLKITHAQIDKFAKEERMPTLKELADEFCEDNDFEYVHETQKVASLEKISNENPSSIYTKLKAYPYEFEINSSLQLASIDGIALATGGGAGGDTSSPSKSKYIMLTSTITNMTGGTFKINVNDVEANNSGKLYYYVNDNLVYEGTNKSYTVTEINGEQLTDNTKYKIKVIADAYELEVTTGEGDNVDAWLACIGNPNTEGYSVNNLDELFQNTTLINNLVNNENAIEYLIKSKEILFPYSANYICASSSWFKIVSNNSTFMTQACEYSEWRNAMYNNYQITESVIANSNTVKNIMKSSTQYAVVTRNSTKDMTAVYDGKAFVFGFSQNWDTSTDTHYLGYYPSVSGGVISFLYRDSYGSSGTTYTINKFASTVATSNRNRNHSSSVWFTIFKI